MKFSICAALFQILLLALFGVLVDYGEDAQPLHKRRHKNLTATDPDTNLRTNDIAVYYTSKFNCVFVCCEN